MKQISKNASTHKIAAAMGDGTSPATVNRWQNSTPEASKVISFCRAYNVDPVDGLMQAGYLTEEEVKRPHLSHLNTTQLLAEVERRTR